METVSLFEETRLPVKGEFEQELLSIDNRIHLSAGDKGHWRIKVGKVTVNYYPFSQNRTIYVNAIPNVQKVIRQHFNEVNDCLKLVKELCDKHLN